ncbi:MAG: alanine racemase [Pseudomonadota bacterium]
MFCPSWIELSESALRQNLRFLREQLGPDVTLCSVVKGNAYGHGIENFVPLAERCGVRQFAVFSADEAERCMRCHTEDSQVMIMGPVDGEALAWAIETGVSFFVHDLPRLAEAIATAQRVRRPALVHLELETGLNRTGIALEEQPQVAAMCQQASADVLVQGVCTHFAGAESVSNYLRIQQQLQRFATGVESLRGLGVDVSTRHTACSAAAFTYPESRLELVRVGIMQYGFWPSRETEMHHLLREGLESADRAANPLKRVMTWKSRVMGVKSVPPGEFVGYGTSYQTTRRERIAQIPVGYYHGFARNLSNLGHVLVRGRRAPVVGAVNMNMMMIDVTDLDGVQAGDEVVLIGRQKRNQITVSSFSELTRFLNYEVLVRLPAAIPRSVVA